MMRFNKKGVQRPFLQEAKSIRPSSSNKNNQPRNAVSNVISKSDYTFKHQDESKTLSEVDQAEWIYCDPPYIGRHVDYFDSWSEQERELNALIKSSESNFYCVHSGSAPLSRK